MTAGRLILVTKLKGGSGAITTCRNVPRTGGDSEAGAGKVQGPGYGTDRRLGAL
jgi:hypothetical protein